LIGIVLNINVIPDSVKYTAGTACLALAVATLDAAAVPFRNALSMKLLVWVGLISFSLYIWQQPFAAIMPHHVIHHVMLRVIPLTAALACAVASYYGVERPARRWLNAHPPRWARSASGGNAAAQSAAGLSAASSSAAVRSDAGGTAASRSASIHRADPTLALRGPPLIDAAGESREVETG
jgi:peptidoglycan/LPS O-acetylase OafA/YrhL